LTHEWQAYISRSHALRKVFVSVKGIYYQVLFYFILRAYNGISRLLPL